MSHIGSARNRRVAIHGLPYFCAKLMQILQEPAWDICHHYYRPSNFFRFARDLGRCDLAFTWGGRISMGSFLRAARYFGIEKVVILWCGSDVLHAQQELTAGKMDSWVSERIHWAASPGLADEVRALGLACENVQISFVQPVSQPMPLPATFSVLVYLPALERASLYGLDRILEVSEQLPNVRFTLVGLRNGETLDGPPNLEVHNRVASLSPFIKRATVVWRPVRHDAGTSFMVLEALAHGRHVLYTYPFPDCIHVKTTCAAREEILRLQALHESGELGMNTSGMETIARGFTPQHVRENLLRRWAEIIDGAVFREPLASTANTGETNKHRSPARPLQHHL